MDAFADAYDHVVDKNLLIRRYNLTAECVLPKEQVDYELENAEPEPTQLNLFTNYEAEEKIRKKQDEFLEHEYDLQKVVLDIKEKFGKNALLKGMSLQDGATMKERNAQIGGHKA